jgi:hypothetical protein
MRKYFSTIMLAIAVILLAALFWGFWVWCSTMKIEKRQYEDPAKRFEKIAERQYYRNKN